MKKYLYILYVSVMPLISACSEDSVEVVLPYAEPEEGVTFYVPDFVDESGTRVDVAIDNECAHFSWSEGDVLGVFPEHGDQTSFPISNGIGTNKATFDGAGWALRPNASYAAYYPLQRPLDAIRKNAICVSYFGQIQHGNGSTAHLGAYDYLAAPFTEVDGEGKVNFKLKHLGCLVRFQLTMPEADEFSSFVISSDKKIFPKVHVLDLDIASSLSMPKHESYYSNSIVLGLEDVSTTAPNEVLTLYMMLPDLDLGDVTLKVVGSKTYETTMHGDGISAGYIYSFNSDLSESFNDYEDLGLSVLWATCNVGASNPNSFGDYFAWGETSPKIDFDWGNYKYCNGSMNSLTKYCLDCEYGQVDGRTILEPEDDVATVNWGGLWRMPTRMEMDELMNSCTWEYDDLHIGYTVTGPNGKSIFLPTAGYGLKEEFVFSNTMGFYWCSDFQYESGTSIPANLFFAFDLDVISSLGDDRRFIGGQVRAVRPNPNYKKVSSIQISCAKNTITVGETLQLSAVVSPSDASCQSFSWDVSNLALAEVSSEGLLTAYSSGTITVSVRAGDYSGGVGTCEITIVDNVYHGHEFIDFGLSNGTRWATCNIGAESPERYGVYYAWGETKPKETYDWSSYFDTFDGGETFVTLGKSFPYSLSSTYETATQKWGGEWRMPTKEDLTILKNECRWEWTRSNHGIPGYYVFRAKTESDKGTVGIYEASKTSPYWSYEPHLFFPAAGYCDGDETLSRTIECVFWSSEITSNPQLAYCLVMDQSKITITSKPRKAGLSVRPVFSGDVTW